MSNVIVRDTLAEAVSDAATQPSLEVGFSRTDRTLPFCIVVAVDSEFGCDATLTVQAAARIDDKNLVGQIYKANVIPEPPSGMHMGNCVEATEPGYRSYFDRLHVRPIQPLTESHSPARLLIDLFGWTMLKPISRSEGILQLRKEGPRRAIGFGASRTEVLPRPKLKLTVITHAWKFDLARIFGKRWYQSVLHSGVGRRLELRDRKLPVFAEAGSEPACRYRAPAVEFLQFPDGELVAIELEFRDTNVVFGSAKLSQQSETYANVGKSDALSPAELGDMKATFTRRPAAAYCYALRDAVNTLLVFERMERFWATLQGKTGSPSEDYVPMGATPGRNAVELLVGVAQRAAEGSALLDNRNRIKQLWRRSGAVHFEGAGSASRYKAQTAKVQAGLQLPRTPDSPRYISPGKLVDVDMRSCFPGIISGMAVYLGRPIVLEPGRLDFLLAEAAKYADDIADKDAWFIRVTGNIPSGLNVLIPSVDEAVTRDNYRKRKPETVTEVGSSRLFSHRIESGVVTWHTWQVIQRLPRELRKEYEALRVESLILYPRDFVAATGAEYDTKVEEFRTGQVDWGQRLDLPNRRLTTVQHLDEQYVTLWVSFKDLLDKLIDIRREAQAEGNRGLGTAAKLLSNTMYGVLAGSGITTSNVVAGQHITSAARAEAFLLSMALNGLETVVDGLVYDRDRIPADDFKSCLRRQTDYPFRIDRGEAGHRYLPETEVPTDDRAFTEFARWQVDRFFGEGTRTH
jgi:hypothetical protein